MRNEDSGEGGAPGKPASSVETNGQTGGGPGWSGNIAFPVSLLDYFV